MGARPRAPDAVARWVRERLPALLRRRGAEAAWLFGSWGRGEADRLSDVDVLVVAPSGRPFVDRFRDFPELVRGAPVGLDLLVYTPEEFARERRLNRFLRHVLREAQRVV